MKAAVFFADGFEDIEALSPVDYMRRAGIEVITVGVKGKPFNDTMIVTSSHKVPMIMDTTLDAFLKDYADKLPDCVVCPGGGLGAQNLSENAQLLDFLEKCNASGKLVAALCASPAVVLGKTNILKNKKWTC
jgi:4-methyl-5(b-hydroxyethyl)-thiazole monophosphate biosynthesis